MAGLAKHLALATIEADLSKTRLFSALRRGLVVWGLLVIGYVFISPQAGVNAATSALIVGLLDKGRSPRNTRVTMAGCTALLVMITLVAGVFASFPLVLLIFMALLAFSAGLSVGIDPRLPQMIVYGAVLMATYLLAPLQPNQIIPAAIIALIAGGAQTLFALIAAPIVGDMPERRLIAQALLTTADDCDAVGSAHFASGDFLQTSNAMSAAQTSISKTDMANINRQRYSVLLADTDVLRVESRGFDAREHLGIRVPADQVTLSTFTAAANILRLAATALTSRHMAIGRGLSPADQAQAELEQAGRSLPDTGTAPSRTAQSVVDAAREIPAHVHEILASPQARRLAQKPALSLRDRVAGSLAWGSTPLKHGFRMASAAVVGEIVAQLLGLDHGSWVAVTAMMLLRPDVGPTVPRIVMRALGTTLAMGAVVGIVFICQDSTAALIIAIGIVACLLYSLLAVNYNLSVTLMATTVLLILSLTGLDPVELSLQRWVDVLVGCVIGTAFALVFPIWKSNSLATDTADYADALAGWISQIATAARTQPSERGDQLAQIRRAARTSRDRRQTVLATHQTSLLEPKSSRLSAGAVGVVLSWMRRTGEAAIAAETLVRHGVSASEIGAQAADRAAADLAAAAVALRASQKSTEMVNVSAPTQSTFAPNLADNDRVAIVLNRAQRSANSALRAVERATD